MDNRRGYQYNTKVITENKEDRGELNNYDKDIINHVNAMSYGESEGTTLNNYLILREVEPENREGVYVQQLENEGRLLTRRHIIYKGESEGSTITIFSIRSGDKTLHFCAPDTGSTGMPDPTLLDKFSAVEHKILNTEDGKHAWIISGSNTLSFNFQAALKNGLPVLMHKGMACQIAINPSLAEKALISAVRRLKAPLDSVNTPSGGLETKKDFQQVQAELNNYLLKNGFNLADFIK